MQAGDQSSATHSSLVKREQELSDIDRELEALTSAPSAYLRESTFRQPTARAYHIAMAGFFFLRFVCPAIVAPDACGLWSSAPAGANCRRALLLLSKVVQTLANDMSFARKEQFLAPLDRMHQRNREPLRRFFVYLADEGYECLCVANITCLTPPPRHQPKHERKSDRMAARGVGSLSAQPIGVAGSADDIDDLALVVKSLRALCVATEPEQAARAANADVALVVVRYSQMLSIRLLCVCVCVYLIIVLLLLL
jgi:hypothetical protein